MRHSLEVIQGAAIIFSSAAWALVSHVVSGRVFEFFWKATDNDL